MNLNIVDIFVLAVYLLGVAALGIWLGRGTKDLTGYLLGDRHLPWWAILGSIVATETSTATFLSVPGVAFAKDGDMRFLQLTLGYLLGRIVVVFTLLPAYFRGDIFTAYEVLAKRFGGFTKQTAAVIFLFTRNLGDGLRLFLTAIVLEQVADIPLTWCIIVIGSVTIVYTLLGGMKAVVWNDCIQFLVYMAGGAIASWVILQGLPNGWSEFVRFGQSEHKFRLFDFQWDLGDAYTFWSAVIGGMFLTLGTHGTDQMMVQRLLCAKSKRDASKALIASGFVVMLQFALFLSLGVGLAAFYQAHPPSEPFASNDRVFATFIVTELPIGRGVIGLVLAAVFAAAMSTLSSSINSSAGSLVNDIILPSCSKKPLTVHAQLQLTRWLTVVFGLVQIVVAIGAQDLSTSVVQDALAIAGFSAGLLLGVFALGLATRSVGQGAAAGGLVWGLTCLLAVKFAVPIWNPEMVVAWPWYAVIGSLTTFVGGMFLQRWLTSTVGSSP